MTKFSSVFLETTKRIDCKLLLVVSFLATSFWRLLRVFLHDLLDVFSNASLFISGSKLVLDVFFSSTFSLLLCCFEQKP